MKLIPYSDEVHSTSFYRSSVTFAPDVKESLSTCLCMCVCVCVCVCVCHCVRECVSLCAWVLIHTAHLHAVHPHWTPVNNCIIMKWKLPIKVALKCKQLPHQMIIIPSFPIWYLNRWPEPRPKCLILTPSSFLTGPTCSQGSLQITSRFSSRIVSPICASLFRAHPASIHQN